MSTSDMIVLIPVLFYHDEREEVLVRDKGTHSTIRTSKVSILYFVPFRQSVTIRKIKANIR